ncbi:MAG: epimerase [Saprospiraceae bacterium]|nr:epimerase [Saprospiraceae bacterium]
MINAIIFGSTGMVGEGVAHECMLDHRISKVLLINRSPTSIKGPKVTELIQRDFFDLSEIEDQLRGYNACYFCMGISSVGQKEEAYRKVTYDLTLYVAELLLKINPDMTFIYVSGAGTESSEQGSSMWARVKGATENAILNQGFKDAYAFRPGYIQPTKGLKNAYKVYSWLGFLYPLFRALFPKYVTTLKEIGVAMINVTALPDSSKVVECRDIVRLSHRVS